MRSTKYLPPVLHGVWHRLRQWLWPMPQPRARRPLTEAERQQAMRWLADIDRRAADTRQWGPAARSETQTKEAT